MKKIFLVLLIAVGYTAGAQEISKNAIGLRLGDDDGFGAEVTYQRAIQDNNRLEFDLGVRSGKNYDGFKLAGLYQWVWNIDGGFNWYAGAGGGIGAYDYDNDFYRDEFRNDYNETFAFVAGDVGIEYNFDIPLLLSLDVRPEIAFGDIRDDLHFDLALSVRYQF
ncbi:hypothetical protein [Lacinutrix sp. 5H-3-7-4]|uniref:hypothetical protein n=1 Tax=Lacinutrix sp. (strain 5H-3-7-4) TaxID=983544 RepID=UPI00020A3339|nr:hypothetical protein [Lacinutrix sp. 5H-3-7-4]AEH02409.1 hypothetical protein Lacal_2568 [Lacinutrix sp. 5H-3-7-4]